MKNRRGFLTQSAALAGLAASTGIISFNDSFKKDVNQKSKQKIIGHGDFTYNLDRHWATAGSGDHY